MPLTDEFGPVFELMGKDGKFRLTASAQRIMATMNKLALFHSLLAETTGRTLVFFNKLASLRFYAKQLIQCLSIDGPLES